MFITRKSYVQTRIALSGHLFQFHLLSCFFEIGLKKTIKWFHMLFFGKKNVIA